MSRGRPRKNPIQNSEFGALLQSKIKSTTPTVEGSEPRQRGRQAGQKKQEIRIIDPTLGDYQIAKDEHGYAVIDVSGPMEKKVMFPSTFGNCLKHIATALLMDRQKQYTIKEYLNTYQQILNTFNNIVEI